MPSSDGRFGEDYFERGVEAGISCYTNYRWMPERSHAEARGFLAWMAHPAGEPASVTDYGCAKGFFVRALLEQGHDARGVDISGYALSCANPPVSGNLRHVDELDGWASRPSAYGFCKDTLEHCRSEAELAESLRRMAGLAKRWLLIVPLADDGKYRIAKYERDVTHEIRWNEAQWLKALLAERFAVQRIRYAVPGLKEHWVAVCSTGNWFVEMELR